MGNLHQVVINNVGEVVSRKSVTLHDHLVINGVVVEDHLSVDHVLEFRFAVRDEHSDHVGFAVGDTLIDFILGKAVAESIVLGLRVLGATLLDAHLLEAVGGAEAVVSVFVFEQCITKLRVCSQARGLLVGVMRSFSHVVWLNLFHDPFVHRSATFVVFQASPFETIYDFLDTAFHLSGFVCVFNSENELALVLYREQVVVEGGP